MFNLDKNKNMAKILEDYLDGEFYDAISLDEYVIYWERVHKNEILRNTVSDKEVDKRK